MKDINHPDNADRQLKIVIGILAVLEFLGILAVITFRLL
jgi:hypothetical protein